MKRYNTYGVQVCGKCIRENNIKILERKKSLGILPTPCPQCNSPRVWSTSGQSVCPSCRAAYLKKWAENNVDLKKNIRRASYEKNKKEYLKKSKKYREENREKVNEQKRKYFSQFDREYWVWKEENARCHRTTHKHYADWGGRGIHVYEPWRRDPTLSKE